MVTRRRLPSIIPVYGENTSLFNERLNASAPDAISFWSLNFSVRIIFDFRDVCVRFDDKGREKERERERGREEERDLALFTRPSLSCEGPSMRIRRRDSTP